MTIISGGMTALALLGSAATAPQTAPSTSAKPKAARGSYFTSNQSRADVPAHVERMFKQLDLNHDGFVTRDEIAASQARFDEKMSKNGTKRAAALFDRLDANHDGKITDEEVEAVRAARSGDTAKKPKRKSGSSLFARADANKDGVVTRAEFDAAVAGGKIKLRHANMRGSAIVRLFDDADVNKDGKVSLEEAQAAALKHFDAADSNHDGTLTPDERRQASKAARAKRKSAG